MSHFKRHLFFCTNVRDDRTRPGCGTFRAQELRDYAKAKVKQLGLSGEGKVRINSSGCLDRCELGPVCVVYPDAVWYRYFDEGDIDQIIDQHVIGGEVVESLKI